MVKRELFLHIGTTKTGSTSIQKVLSQSRPALLAQGVCYPVTPGRTQHTMLTYGIMSPQERSRRFDARDKRRGNDDSPEERTANFIGEFDREMEQLPDNVTRVILSSETIYVHLRRTDEVAQLHDFLRPRFNSVKVVVYLRRQDAHLTSLYTQMLRAGIVRAPSEFEIRERPMHELDYEQLLRRWADVFGQENIQPRVFERSADRRFDVVEDFCATCGIEVPDVEDSIRESNPSIEVAGQELLAELGKLIQERTNSQKVASPVWRRLTQAVTQACQGSGWKPARPVAEEFYNQYREGNDAVRQIWFPDRTTLFTDDFSEYPESAIPATLEGRHAAACRTILALADRDMGSSDGSVPDAVEEPKLEEGDARELRVALRRIVNANDQDPVSRARLAELLIDCGKIKEARFQAAAALQLMPDSPEIRALNERVLAIAVPKKGNGQRAGRPAREGRRGKSASANPQRRRGRGQRTRPGAETNVGE